MVKPSPFPDTPPRRSPGVPARTVGPLYPGGWAPAQDTCVPAWVSFGGPSGDGTCQRGRHPQTRSWGRPGDGGRGLSVPPGLHCQPGDRSFTSLPGTPKAGVSQADSLQVAHTYTSLQWIWKGEVKLEFLLAGDSEALPQVLGTCASWQEEVISSFLSAFYPGFASPLIRVAKGR